MRRVMKIVASTGFLVLCLAAPAQAQWCWDVCTVPEPGSGFNYPYCNRQCNNGGGDYTTCGGAGYDCCTQGIQTVDVLGEWSYEVNPFWCDLTAVVERRWATFCPDQNYYTDTWCEEVDSGWAFKFGVSCCEVGPCWGQQYC